MRGNVRIPLLLLLLLMLLLLLCDSARETATIMMWVLGQVQESYDPGIRHG